MLVQLHSKMQKPSLSYHKLAPQEAIKYFESNGEQGLSSLEVAQRDQQYGKNKLRFRPGKPAWLKFLLQFNQPLLYILLLAGGIKAILGSWTNAAVIWGVTLINAIIGYLQEAQAEDAIASLAQAVTTEVTVIREGQKLRISSQDLVPGDLVALTSGDKVPADIRLLKVRSLQVDESALTGESLPVNKSVQSLPEDTPLAERTNMAYAGSFVTFGQGRGIVVATANNTEVGQISRSMEDRVSLTTPLTRKFAKFSRTLLYGVAALAALTFVIGLGQGESWLYMFEATVALAVSAIPEGLPAVVTIALAIGVNRMARRHAIIRKLPAVEALGGATVVCSDKTGTLTENQMTVQSIYAGGEYYHVSGSGYSPAGEIRQKSDRHIVSMGNLSPGLEQCLVAGTLCNDSQLKPSAQDWSVEGDPTEGALIAAAAKSGLHQSSLIVSQPRLDEIPFESEYQYMATLHGGVTPTIYVKGSVESLLSRCSQMVDLDGNFVALDPLQIHQVLAVMARQGLRVLAFAKQAAGSQQHSIDHADIATDLIFLGLQGMIDPPRPEAIAAIQTCQTAGIKVKMITGDHITTARAIASQMGIGRTGMILAFEGKQLAKMDDFELTQAAKDGSVFARVAPTQKLRLVEALQSQGEIVAMTGDGVNDAPALKQADVGIAMGQEGTEVARESADMLLTDDNFASIEAAVEEGRTVYQNLRKAIAFLLPVNGGESMTILISALLARDLPILSLQVLWLNMINSISMTVPLAFEPKSSGMMQQPPRNPSEPLLTGKLLKRILLISVFNWILIFAMFEWAKSTTGDIAVARTMAIQSLVAARVIYLLSISQLGKSLVNYLRGRNTAIANMGRIPLRLTPICEAVSFRTRGRPIKAPILIAGIVMAVLLQIIFSQWGVMNILFATAPLSLNQWLICLLAMLPMIPAVILANQIDPA